MKYEVSTVVVIVVAIWIPVGLSSGLSPSWCDPLTLVPLCDHVPDYWQPRILLVMVETRSVNVKNNT